VSESVPHLRRGAIKDFIKIMKWTNRWIPEHWNKTLLKYSLDNGSYIEFFSADQDDKLRGARRHILYINEANNVTQNAYNELSIRTSEDIWLDFNPTSQFWAHTDVVPDNDSELIILTYKDNEGLPQTIVDDIESKRDKALTSDYWANWWKVYGLGEIGNLQGAVFENWKQIDKLPNEARLLGYGMDFGFTNDPSTLIACYKYNDQIIWDEVIYSKGLLNSDIVNVMKSKEVSGTIWADSAETKSIAEIRANGFYIKPTDKGKDSIIYGIGVMQEMDMLVTSRSVNTIKELRGYTWDKDKTGATLNKPIDAMNHSIDAMRYFSMMQFGKKSQGIYHVY